MAAAIPFILGAYIALDMATGSLIVAIWGLFAPHQTVELLAPAVASGLIVGDGVFSIPLSALGAMAIEPPFCMGFGTVSS